MYHMCHSVSTRTVIVVQQDGKLPLVLLLAALGVRSVRAEQEAALGLPVGKEACRGSSSRVWARVMRRVRLLLQDKE
jgi:hypothetical protein